MLSHNRYARQRFQHRYHLLLGGLLLLMVVLFARLFFLQWYQHENLLLQSNSNRINIVPVLPTRGMLLDREGTPLASNKISYRLQVIPEHIQNQDALLSTLQQQLHWSNKKHDIIQRRIIRSRSDRPVLLDDQLSWQQVSPIAARMHHFPGLDVIAGTHRFYPYGELASHLIGYLSLARESDIDKGYRPMEYLGRTGVEHVLEERLHGITGAQKEEVNAQGQRISTLHTTPAMIGENVHLTIDIGLQQAVSHAMGDETGAVVVMDPGNGDVLALLSKPGFNTNHFITGLDTQTWNGWLDDNNKPLLNRTLQAAYPPASTLKVITSLAGLKHQKALAHQATQCDGFIELNDRKLRCWKKHGHGRVDMQQSLTQSCDVYYYKLGEQLGMPDMVAEMQNWGLGQSTNIPLFPESSGNIPTPVQHLANGRTRPWYQGNIMITAIGQGSTTVTPMQIARFAAALANGGDILKPKLFLNQPSEILWHADVKPEHLDTVRTYMRSVVDDPHGTAHEVLRHAKWDIAGKTGTAQVVSMGQDARNNDKKITRHLRDHAWFMGFAPYDNPKVAFAILVEHGEHGSSAAAPIAKTIVNYLAEKEARISTL